MLCSAVILVLINVNAETVSSEVVVASVCPAMYICYMASYGDQLDSS